MLRSLSVAVADLFNLASTPIQDPPPPTFTVRHAKQPYIHDGVGRVYYYMIPTACGSIFFDAACRCDLATHDTMRRAMDQYLKENGPIQEGSVVLRSWDWTGHFTVAENKNTDLLLLRLAEPVHPSQEELR